MAEGTVKRLTDKGFGFIDNGSGKDLFFHTSAVEGCRFEDLREGQKVTYNEGRGAKGPRAENVRNFTQCDSLLLGSDCGAHTVPYIEVKNPTATIEHEATTSKISEDQLFYAMSRGLDQDGLTLGLHFLLWRVLQISGLFRALAHGLNRLRNFLLLVYIAVPQL